MMGHNELHTGIAPRDPHLRKDSCLPTTLDPKYIPTKVGLCPLGTINIRIVHRELYDGIGDIQAPSANMAVFVTYVSCV